LGAVTVLDLGTALANNALELAVGEHLGICDVRMHVLPEGYRFRLADRTPLPPPAKPPRGADADAPD
jgi:cyanophycinase